MPAMLGRRDRPRRVIRNPGAPPCHPQEEQGEDRWLPLEEFQPSAVGLGEV
ncbi:hypothetical protein HCN56_11890, partial [Streptomyces lonarensis]|nr:hypothetical protein [Streptomyces lonarensis]